MLVPGLEARLSAACRISQGWGNTGLGCYLLKIQGALGGLRGRLGSELLFLKLGCRYLLRSVSRVRAGSFVWLGRRLYWGRLYCWLLGWWWVCGVGNWLGSAPRIDFIHDADR